MSLPTPEEILGLFTRHYLGGGGGPFFLLAAYFQGNLDKLLSYHCATKLVCQILLWRRGGDKGLDVLRGLFLDLLI